MYVKNSLFYQCKLTEKQSGCFIGLIPVPSNLMNEWQIKEKNQQKFDSWDKI